MSSTTKSVNAQPTMVSFLHIGEKSTDYRYDKYLEMIDAEKNSVRRLYWIGIIDTKLAGNSQGPISFISYGRQLVLDSFFQRDFDGAIENLALREYVYSFKSFEQELINAKNNGQKWYHVFLEEEIERGGGHTVNLLHIEKMPMGLPCVKIWPDMPTYVFMAMANVDVSNPKIQRHVILHQDSYKWVK